MNAPIVTHSFSSIKMYENCPKRYYHQRITKEVKDEGGSATIHGERVHKMLEDALKSPTGELPPEGAIYAKLLNSVRAYSANAKVLAEQELTLNEHLLPTGWWDADAWIRSKLDVLVLYDDRAVVIDWKTGKRRPDFSQLELFALQVFSHYPLVNKVSSAFVWLQDGTTDKEVYKRDQLDAMWERFMLKVERIQESVKHGVWPAKPSGLCNYCPCKNFCEFRR